MCGDDLCIVIVLKRSNRGAKLFTVIRNIVSIFGFLDISIIIIIINITVMVHQIYPARIIDVITLT